MEQLFVMWCRASLLFSCRSCTIACRGTCIKWLVAASSKWCILGTTQWGSGPPPWLGTDPGPSPHTFMSRTQVSLHLLWWQTESRLQLCPKSIQNPYNSIQHVLHTHHSLLFQLLETKTTKNFSILQLQKKIRYLLVWYESNCKLEVNAK